ncbi:MAG TPA: hypothetical protein VHJ38_06005 [Nitrososphaeraceae archaeon]|nr:hypothetical protein [Nitrososphaeraceae archaeon]
MSTNIFNNVCSMVGIVIDRDMTMHIIENENNPINMHFEDNFNFQLDLNSKKE